MFKRKRKSYDYQRVYVVWRKHDPPGQPVTWLYYKLRLTFLSRDNGKGQWEVELRHDAKDFIGYYYFDTRKSAHYWIKLMGRN